MNNFRTLNWNNRHRKLSQREIFSRTPSVAYYPTNKNSLYHRFPKVIRIHEAR